MLSRFPRLIAHSLILASFPLALAQNQNLHPRIDRGTYSDGKITLRIPVGWTPSIDQQSGSGGLTLRGLVLRHGRYILRLCTGCAQVSGLPGGRFSEIAPMLQPWFRADAGANPSACGEPATTRITAQLVRIDFSFHRSPGHIYSDDNDDCRAPHTTDPVWYGSYFEETCPGVPAGADCGGYFLHLDWLTRHSATNPVDEMAFALTADANAPDAMPLQSDPELHRILSEASAIVASVQFRPPPN